MEQELSTNYTIRHIVECGKGNIIRMESLLVPAKGLMLLMI